MDPYRSMNVSNIPSPPLEEDPTLKAAREKKRKRRRRILANIVGVCLILHGFALGGFGCYQIVECADRDKKERKEKMRFRADEFVANWTTKARILSCREDLTCETTMVCTIGFADDDKGSSASTAIPRAAGYELVLAPMACVR